MKKLLTLSTLALGAIALTAGPADAATLGALIDNFNSGSVAQFDIPPKTFSGSSNPGAGNSVSTLREHSYSSSTTGNPLLPSGFSVNGAPANFSISNAAETTATVALSYTAGGPFNLAVNGANELAFDITSNDLGATVKLTINGVVYTNTTSASQTGPFTVPFGAFAGVDFSSVSSIVLEVSGPSDYDFTIDNFQSQGPDITNIPEPMTILGTGFALAALPSLKKAHKNKKAQ
jgi:hypothetical protein